MGFPVRKGSMTIRVLPSVRRTAEWPRYRTSTIRHLLLLQAHYNGGRAPAGRLSSRALAKRASKILAKALSPRSAPGEAEAHLQLQPRGPEPPFHLQGGGRQGDGPDPLPFQPGGEGQV